MDTEKPRPNTDHVCPLHKKEMRYVCHKCALWVKIYGKDPQSSEMIERWDCSLALLPVLMIENAQMTRQLGAAVESWRNEMVKAEQSKLELAAPYLMGAAKRLEKINASDNSQG